VSIPNARKAVIHVARSQLQMADADYRALLQRAAGVSSSVDLDEAGFTAVMAEFEQLGFRSTRGRAQKERRECMATPAQIGKIHSLWREYIGHDDESALGHWLEKHFHVSHVRFLEGYRAGKCIAVLLKMRENPHAKGRTRRKRNEAKPA
jgi:phage gp16-like protein